MAVSQSRAASGSIAVRNVRSYEPLCSRVARSAALMRGAFCAASPPLLITAARERTGAASTAAQSG